LELRHFPDGETYVRITADVRREDIFIVCTLARPDVQFLPLAFTAATVRGLGAARVQLVAPYLAYMRQDRIFLPGEALTSRLFAELLQKHFDGLITVDPHLHRHASLDEVYDIATTVIHAAPLLASWISEHVENPVVIGPDEESAQWVEAIARDVGAVWAVFKKERRGDRDVRIAAPRLKSFRSCTPVWSTTSFLQLRR
jgi:ribose-phosphate pyrophosphokinase